MAPESIHTFAPHRPPPLVSPSRRHARDREEDIAAEILSKTLEYPHKRKNIVYQIGKECLQVFNDPVWMGLTSEMISTGSQACSFVGGAIGQIAPVLNIVSAPLFLHHSLKETNQRFGLAKRAFQANRVADSLFWSGRGMSSFGTALGDMIKPFAGCATLLGLSQIPAMSFIFSHVIPILMMAFGSLGGASQGWALVRSLHALEKFKKKHAQADESFDQMIAFLTFLQGPKRRRGQTREDFELDQVNFRSSYFTQDGRRLDLEKRIQNLLGTHDLHAPCSTNEKASANHVQKAYQALHKTLTSDSENFDGGMKEAAALLEEVQALFDPSAPVSKKRKITAQLYDEILPKLQTPELGLTKEIRKLVVRLERRRAKFHKEMHAIAETAESEIHRNLLTHALWILVAALSLIAGSLYLSFPASIAPSGISLASSGIAISTFILEKWISQGEFTDLERSLRLLSKRKTQNPHY